MEFRSGNFGKEQLRRWFQSAGVEFPKILRCIQQETHPRAGSQRGSVEKGADSCEGIPRRRKKNLWSRIIPKYWTPWKSPQGIVFHGNDTLEKSMENSCRGMDSRRKNHRKLTLGWIHGEIHGKLPWQRNPWKILCGMDSRWKKNPWRIPLGWPRLPALPEGLRARGIWGREKLDLGSCSDSVGNKLIVSQILSLSCPDGISWWISPGPHPNPWILHYFLHFHLILAFFHLILVVFHLVLAACLIPVFFHLFPLVFSLIFVFSPLIPVFFHIIWGFFHLILEGFCLIPVFSPSSWCFSILFWHFSPHPGVFPPNLDIFGPYAVRFLHNFGYFSPYLSGFPLMPVFFHLAFLLFFLFLASSQCFSTKSWCFSTSLCWGFPSFQCFSPHSSGFPPNFEGLGALFQWNFCLISVFFYPISLFSCSFWYFPLILLFPPSFWWFSPHPNISPPHFIVFFFPDLTIFSLI